MAVELNEHILNAKVIHCTDGFVTIVNGWANSWDSLPMRYVNHKIEQYNNTCSHYLNNH